MLRSLVFGLYALCATSTGCALEQAGVAPRLKQGGFLSASTFTDYDLPQLKARLTDSYGGIDFDALWNDRLTFAGEPILHGYEVELLSEELIAAIKAHDTTRFVAPVDAPCQRASNSLAINFVCLFRPLDANLWKTLTLNQRITAFQARFASNTPNWWVISHVEPNLGEGSRELQDLLKELKVGQDHSEPSRLEIWRKLPSDRAQTIWDEREQLSAWLDVAHQTTAQGLRFQHHVSFHAKRTLQPETQEALAEWWRALGEFLVVAFGCSSTEAARYLIDQTPSSRSVSAPTSFVTDSLRYAQSNDTRLSIIKRHGKPFSVGLRYSLSSRPNRYWLEDGSADPTRLGYEIRLPKWRSTAPLARWAIALTLGLLRQLDNEPSRSPQLRLGIGEAANYLLTAPIGTRVGDRLKQDLTILNPQTSRPVKLWRKQVLALPLLPLERRVAAQAQGLAAHVESWRDRYAATLNAALQGPWEVPADFGALAYRSDDPLNPEIPGDPELAAFASHHFLRWCRDFQPEQLL